MADYRELAKEYLKKGLTIIPVNTDKQSRINWTKYQNKHITEEEIEMYFKDCFGVAMLTGGLNGVECIDIDSKYDLRGDLTQRFKDACDVAVLKKLWVQKTRSGGFHWVYKTDVVEPNQQLARRKTTPYEQYETFMDNFNDLSKREFAASTAANDKTRVLIETRGGEESNGEKLSKGYFLIAPTPGYEKVYGELTYLKNDERNHLVEKARELNEYFTKERNYKIDSITRNSGVSIFETFNKEGDSLKILTDNGWEILSTRGKNYRLKRPGKTDSASSALYDSDSRLFKIFSTSYCLDPNKTYTASDLLIELEADGDTTVAYKILVEMGY